MAPKLALKKLTASDLTLSEWHFRTLNAGNQKAINLNADVFVDQLFPAIEDATRGTGGRLPLDLWVYGPDNAGPINLQRKIIKGAAYKNWRLDGEFIVNPVDEPERFNVLAPDDYVVLAFDGDVVPSSATAIFVARAAAQDSALHAALDSIGLTGRNTMIALDEPTLREVVARAGLAEDHPLVSLTLTEELQEAALGGAAATERLLRTGRAPRVSAATLKRAREAAEAVGELGEELVALHFDRKLKDQQIESYEWVSRDNAVAPLDFRITANGQRTRIDVKTTRGEFERDFHVSLPELREMAAGTGVYRIYRVYEATPDGAKLRVSEDMRAFAGMVLGAFSALPGTVIVDAVSISPAAVTFGEEIDLAPAEEVEGA